MIIRRELARAGDRTLFELQFVGASGQNYRLSYEVIGPERLYFATREEAEAELSAGSV